MDCRASTVAAAMMRGPLSMADVEAFQRDGVVVLRRAFDPAPYASAAVDELNWNMEQEPGSGATISSAPAARAST
ncbi:hypothetical protein JL720_7674 [Aureococcus anophagefferens]|nr:hypothetical protein JL720_7674 [Aureococcus anophagefferens]